MVAGEEEIEQGSAGVADMQQARGRGCKARTDRHAALISCSCGRGYPHHPGMICVVVFLGCAIEGHKAVTFKKSLIFKRV
ncbi:hypothetical protein GCM10007868_19460 [Gluconobacter frateurii]|uniref:Uncharacterized protein n=1 Tax=Gluconobacter frateurii NRIC 0228 TaxID=1307946 RepID=A0ABQ0Q8L4_9PROT|nr:hypothetical protein AA0228_0557 [Gluconobacter frateurii NRIC 0228]GLP90871.1 hypothetical protein GCM10007868_19460 [Gluconobacter frateurii]